MPRDRFAFAIRVSREIYLARFPGGGLELRERLLLARNRDVLGLEVVFDIDTHLLHRKITDVTDRRAHLVPAPEILPDSLGLGRRLDDNQRLSIATAVHRHVVIVHDGFGSGS